MHRCALCVSSVVMLAVSMAGTAEASVLVSGYISDPETSYTPLSNTLGQYSEMIDGTIQRSVAFDQEGIPGSGYFSRSRHAAAASGGGPGYVNASNSAQYIWNDGDGNPGKYFLHAESSVVATWNDIVVSGPAGASMVPISANLLIHGSYLMGSSNVVDPHNVGWSMASAASFGFTINGTPTTSGNWTQFSSRGGAPYNTLGNGVFTNFNGTYQGATDIVMVPANTPFSISMFLLVYSEINLPAGASISIFSSTDFGHTASLATDGPAFNVPAGYTVNSAEAGVEDNGYVLVPAPGSAAVALSAGVLIGVRRRR